MLFFQWLKRSLLLERYGSECFTHDEYKKFSSTIKLKWKVFRAGDGKTFYIGAHLMGGDDHEVYRILKHPFEGTYSASVYCENGHWDVGHSNTLEQAKAQCYTHAKKRLTEHFGDKFNRYRSYGEPRMEVHREEEDVQKNHRCVA